jgi:hypothetical protein
MSNHTEFRIIRNSDNKYSLYMREPREKHFKFHADYNTKKEAQEVIDDLESPPTKQEFKDWYNSLKKKIE